jgi:hypothetical protein
MAEKMDFKIQDRTHPLYNDYIDEWNFYLEAAMGGRDYCGNRDNLFTHRLEDESDFNNRLKRVYYLNYCNLVCSIYADYIFKEAIRRPENSVLDDFRGDVDGKGTDIDSFMTKLSFLSSVYGHVHVLVDAPNIVGGRVPLHTYRSNTSEFDPYLVVIPPTELRDWSLDKYGKPEWVLIRMFGYEDSDPLVPREDDTTYLLITRNDWTKYSKDGVEIESGEHGLGEVYMTTCYNKDTNLDMVGESLITDISRINRIIYNWCSNIDEMIERQTFSQLVMPQDPHSELHQEDEGGAELGTLGTAQIFTFPANSSQPPRFISPDVAQLDIIWSMIQQHVDKIYELAGLGTVGNQSKFLSQRSGISQAYQFLSINSSLAKKSIRLEKSENDINRLILKWRKEDYTDTVEYPRQFDILGLTEIMDATFKIVTANFSETLNIELLKALAKKSAPVLSDATLESIYKEIEAKKGKIENPLAALQEEGGAFGNYTPARNQEDDD